MKYYNYIYLDPRKPGQYTYVGLDFSLLYKPFYVGKGTGTRYLDHIREAKRNKSYNKYKIRIINKIIKKDYDMKDYIIVFNYTDDEYLAYKNENEVINHIGLDNLVNDNEGGKGGMSGHVTVKDKDGNMYYVSVNDPRYKSGELIHMNVGRKLTAEAKKKFNRKGKTNSKEHNIKIGEANKGKVAVKDKDGNVFKVSTDDERYKSGELLHNTKGNVVVKDKDGNIMSVSVEDLRYKSSELISIHTGKVVVKDKDGNTFQVSVKDPRFLDGTYISLHKGKITSIETKNKISEANKGNVVVKDKNGDTFKVDKDDPRYKSGELVGHTKGKVAVKDKDGNTFQVDKDDPRYKSGELVGVNKGYQPTEETRKKLGEAKRGSKNSTARKINIYNDKDELMFKCYGNFLKVCEENGLPTAYLNRCYIKNIKINYRGSRKTIAINNGNVQFQGWYARYID